MCEPIGWFICGSHFIFAYFLIRALCAQGRYSIGLLYWLLAREVLRLRGAIDRYSPWDASVDLFFYRDPEELKSLEDEKIAAAAATGTEAAAYEEVPVYEAGAEGAAEGFAAPEGFDASAAPQWTEAVPAAGWGEAAPVPTESWGAQATY